MQKSIKFKNRSWEIAAQLNLPENFDENQKHSAIICTLPTNTPAH